MPMYEYACDACGNKFDVRQHFDDEPVRTCPNCGAAVRRVLFPAGIIFRGRGFSVTENRRGNGVGSSAESDSADVATSEPEPAASSE